MCSPAVLRTQIDCLYQWKSVPDRADDLDAQHDCTAQPQPTYYYLCCLAVVCMQIDRLYQWKSVPDGPVRDAFKRQKEHVMKEFDDRSSQVFLQLNEQVCCLLRCG
jgi:hypothetical protein